jgi:hypothetical protein
MVIEKDSGIRRVIRPQPKLIQIRGTESRRGKRQVDIGKICKRKDIGKICKRKEGNVDTGKGT